MPTYQYACTACDERLELVQKFSDEPLTECPNCHGRLRKVFSPVGVVFKGSGFYRTDSRSSSGAGKSESSSKGSGSSAGSSDSGSSSSAGGSSSAGSSGGSEKKSDSAAAKPVGDSKVA